MKMMICGSRGITDLKTVIVAVEQSGWVPTEIISGGAKGIDRLAEEFARMNGLTLTVMKPDWKRYGRGAGLRRNLDMLEACECVVAIWDGVSRGTKHSINSAKEIGRPVFVVNVPAESA